MKAIVAVGKENYVIGKDGTLPWGKIKKDMQWYRKHVVGNVTVMGRTTYESMPPFKDRFQIIITSNSKNFHCYGEEIAVNSIKESLNAIRKEEENGREVYIIGGKQIFDQMIKYCDEVIVTEVSAKDGHIIEGDTFFDKELLNDFQEVNREPEEDEDYNLEFVVYRR